MTNQAIFITGGSGGMGVATGRLFASKGWLVCLADLNAEALASAKAEIGRDNVMTQVLDVTDESQFTPAFDTFAARSGGRMDILFNNAGIAPGGRIESMPTDTVQSVIDINVMGVIHGIRAGLPLLRQTENSLCISTSSSCATFGHAGRAVYTASKFAVKGLTEALSIEFEPYGVRTADVLPGCIDTPMLRRELANGRGKPFEESMLESLPQEGPYRVIPATAIADAVWHAYEDSSRIHFYVPEEVGDIDRIKGTDIDGARNETKKFLGR